MKNIPIFFISVVGIIALVIFFFWLHFFAPCNFVKYLSTAQSLPARCLSNITSNLNINDLPPNSYTIVQPNPVAPTTSYNLESQSQCVTQGQDFFLKFRASAGTNLDTSWSAPEYHFSTRLQTCLLAWQYETVMSLNASSIDKYRFRYGGVIDVLTKQKILAVDDWHNDR